VCTIYVYILTFDVVSSPSTTMTILPVMEGHTGTNELRGVYSDTKRSLLVVNRGIGLGFHYDSLSDRNDQVAKETLGKISALLTQSTSKASL